MDFLSTAPKKACPTYSCQSVNAYVTITVTTLEQHFLGPLSPSDKSPEIVPLRGFFYHQRKESKNDQILLTACACFFFLSVLDVLDVQRVLGPDDWAGVSRRLCRSSEFTGNFNLMTKVSNSPITMPSSARRTPSPHVGIAIDVAVPLDHARELCPVLIVEAFRCSDVPLRLAYGPQLSNPGTY
ncbi:uncharacterized protein LAJ45_01811 [Morchella importuna]|uniref:uncharacterized protein n=1 Tax=Morchella importuna TaxID=1174673 RepID=UPI001E8CCE46|nr:uncharacterized protein LAJ45_01811 [Morchella importuna]KAH8154044.1 hypothetical protein LAJ45_01811 [Morchella importuna]